GSLEPAVHGVYGVFSVQPPLLGQNNDEGYNAEQEVEQGKRLGDLAKAAGVKHFVYSSAGGADRNSPLAHVNSKWQVEQYLRTLDLPLTVIYPVFFMENFNWNRQEIAGGHLTVALKPETRLQVVAVDDIGAFVALVFSHPDEYIGQGFELAGDELTMPQAASIFSQITGHPVDFAEQPLEQLASFSPEMAEMMQEFNLKPNQADIGDLRQRHPGLMTLKQWLQTSGW
ncbi:MAG: NmrA family NAD(P)-binding protein, partial [Candidatus Promineifilaceae bacterium]|nr:NmrA family NAD(P)-binding protein [Candidatus Promineifilaceae bacterium]